MHPASDLVGVTWFRLTSSHDGPTCSTPPPLRKNKADRCLQYKIRTHFTPGGQQDSLDQAGIYGRSLSPHAPTRFVLMVLGLFQFVETSTISSTDYLQVHLAPLRNLQDRLGLAHSALYILHRHHRSLQRCVRDVREERTRVHRF